MAKGTRPYHHGDLRRVLIEEAARLVESEGTRGLTLRKVARRLGVSHSAPSHHFHDKAALLDELAADGFERLAEALESAGAGAKDPEAPLLAQGRAYVRFALEAPGHFRVMFGSSLRDHAASPRLASTSGRAYGALEGAVSAALGSAKARSRKRVREAAFLAWSVVHGAAMLLLDRALPGEKLSDAAATELVESITAAAVRAVSTWPKGRITPVS